MAGEGGATVSAFPSRTAGRRPRARRRDLYLVKTGPPMRLCELGEQPRITATRADAVASIKRLYPVNEWEAAGMRLLGAWTRTDNEMWADA